MIKLFKNESGYSLVEVMVSIMILGIAIIPMVGMFDTGLKTATTGSNYDKARTLANQQMERVKNLSYSQVVVDYPPPTPACKVSLPQGFTCQMNTYYLDEANNFQRPTPALTSGKVMEIVVTINWDGGSKEYKTTGLKAKGT